MQLTTATYLPIQAELSQGHTFSIQNDLLKLDGKIERLWRHIIPFYARRRDEAVANWLDKKLQQACHEEVKEDISSISKINELFLSKVISAYCIKGKLAVVEQEMRAQLKAISIAELFKLPITTVTQSPDFVDFIYRNHLHHRVDEHYRSQGLGFVLNENGQICVPCRNDQDLSRPILKPWNELPLYESGEQKGKIQGWELMAYGWQEWHANQWDNLVPIKVLDQADIPFANPSQYTMNLVTVSPSYNIQHFGLGFFGHSYFELYEPIYEDGNFTGKINLYSIGYNLRDIVIPDPFQFVPRKRISTPLQEGLEEKDNFEKLKELIVGLHKLNLAKKSKEVDLPEDISEIDQEIQKVAHKIWTCTNFATLIYEHLTHKKIDARPLLMRVFFPAWTHKYIDRLVGSMPEFVQKIAHKVQFITRGQFPAFMYNIQKSMNKKVKQVRNFRSYAPFPILHT